MAICLIRGPCVRILAQSNCIELKLGKRWIEKNLEIMVKVGREYGLEINKEKSKVMVYGGKSSYDEIGGIKVEKSIKYLGLMIDDEKDIFKT